MILQNSKVDNLLELKKKIKKSIIPNLIKFNVYDISKYDLITLNKISKKFKKKKIAVRSSAINEDNLGYSNAGKYHSEINIPTVKIKEVKSAIEKVCKKLKFNKKNNLFIQEMVENPDFAGVCFTKSINNNLDGYEINFTEDKKTDSITSGTNNGFKLFIIENKIYKIPRKFKKLIEAIKEIENLIGEKALDIEFAVKKNKIFILQVRKLFKTNSLGILATKKLMEKLHKKINKLKKQSLNSFGKTTYFGVMPDWNPAEIIGTKPYPMSLSLYKELITDNIWSKHRKNYGYHDIYPSHLMTNFFGTPYVDLRIDFNSWVPNSIPDKTKEKLVNFYLNKFSKNKLSHDKIEFDIIFSCCAFDSKKKIYEELKKNKFKTSEIKIIHKSLLNITKNIFYKYKDDYNDILKLDYKQKLINNSSNYTLEKIFWLVNDCKTFGTLPFAGLARCAFVAIEFLNSLVRLNIFSENDKNNFLLSLNSISSEIIDDYNLMNKKTFLKKYGHLRPNTYNLMQKNYKDGFDDYFKNLKPKKIIKKKFMITKHQSNEISKLIKKNNLDISINNFFKFLKESIELREKSKFIFTKSIDLIFENLKILSKRTKITYEDFSYLEIGSITKLFDNLDNLDLAKKFKSEIELNKKNFKFNQGIKLPDIILSSKDIYQNYQRKHNANFIGKKNISGKLIFIKDQKIPNLNNKIVCVENADPGYDYIFNYDILGLITKYGGVNSHMAIRCSELSVPAAIGIGQNKFEEIENKEFIHLDCISNKIS